MNTTTLKVRHDYQGHLWCGIGALSAAAHIQTSLAKKIIRSISLRKYIKAVTYSEMEHALRELGHKVKFEFFPRNWRKCPTLDNWIKQKAFDWHGCLPAHTTFVICITGHWIVIRGNRWVCAMNQTERKLDDCPYLTARVRHVVSFKPNPYA